MVGCFSLRGEECLDTFFARHLFLFFEERVVPFPEGVHSLFLVADYTPCAAFLPKAFVGGTCPHRSFRFCDVVYFVVESPAVPLPSSSFFCGLLLRGLTSCRRTFERNLSSPLVLHGSCFTRFHQVLGWLSCLRPPTFRHAVEVALGVSCFTGRTLASCYGLPVRPCTVIGAPISCLLDAHSCRRYTPNDSSAPISCLLVQCTVNDLTPEWSSRL